MSKLTSLIEKTVSKELDDLVLDEAAVSVQELDNDNYALFIDGNKETGFIKLTLYDPSVFERSFNSSKGIDATRLVKGYIMASIQPSCGAWFIKLVAAEQGMGPTMYDILMTLISPGFLAPDRRVTSDAARRVWNYMFINRRSDFNIQPLQTNRPECKHKQGGLEALNYGYSIKKKLDFRPLVKTHLQLMEMLVERNSYYSQQELEQMISDEGLNYYNERSVD